MCRMTETGARGAEQIDRAGLWYVCQPRSSYEAIYLRAVDEGHDMAGFRPMYRIRVKARALTSDDGEVG